VPYYFKIDTVDEDIKMMEEKIKKNRELIKVE